MVGEYSVNDCMETRLKDAKSLVKRVKAMNAEDTNALSNKKWQEFLTAKRYARDFDYEY